MVRKIVMLRPREWLGSAFRAQSFSMAAAPLAASFAGRGVRFLPNMPPIRVPTGRTTALLKGTALLEDISRHFDAQKQAWEKDPLSYSGPDGHAYAVVAEFDSDAAANDLPRTNSDEVVAVFSDPQIRPFPVTCPGGTAVGTAANAQARLNLGPLGNLKGNGVRVAILDTGVDGTQPYNGLQINVAGGWSPRPGVIPGQGIADHGTMVAWDVLLAAPNAIILDYPLLSAGGAGWIGFLSDAIKAYALLLIDRLQNAAPLISVNSWGMYDRSTDAPAGSPQNYSSNPQHPFNQIVAAAVGAGIDVVFAAGNCGSKCPADRCGAHDVGPGNSIHGANGHPEVVSVGAVTVNDDILGYSSEGPAALGPQKPDIAAFSHFAGSSVFPVDGGTSAACPVVAGVIAALRSKPAHRTIAPARVKAVLCQSARRVYGGAWHPQVGYGVVDAGAALALLP